MYSEKKVRTVSTVDCTKESLQTCTADMMSLVFLCLFLAQQPPDGHGLLIHEVSRSHTTTDHSR
jgi:flagellar biosynthesis protein FliR